MDLKCVSILILSIISILLVEFLPKDILLWLHVGSQPSHSPIGCPRGPLDDSWIESRRIESNGSDWVQEERHAGLHGRARRLSRRHRRLLRSRERSHGWSLAVGARRGGRPAGLGGGYRHRRRRLLRARATGRRRLRAQERRQVHLLPPPPQLAAPQVKPHSTPQSPSSASSARSFVRWLGVVLRSGECL